MVCAQYIQMNWRFLNQKIRCVWSRYGWMRRGELFLYGLRCLNQQYEVWVCVWWVGWLIGLWGSWTTLGNCLVRVSMSEGKLGQESNQQWDLKCDFIKWTCQQVGHNGTKVLIKVVPGKTWLINSFISFSASRETPLNPKYKYCSILKGNFIKIYKHTIMMSLG